jgi:hypothetical protein
MSFDEITPEAFEPEAVGAEEQEVAEPAPETTDQGAEEQEVAEPASEEAESEDAGEAETESGKTEADARFAEMRRQLEESESARAEIENELASLKAKQEAREAAMENMDIDDIDAIAEQAGITREEVMEAIQREEEAAEAELESKQKDHQIAQLQEELEGIYIEREIERDLATLQKLDPSIKTVDDLDDKFLDYVGAGLSAEDAYYAVKGRELSTRSTPPAAPGRISDTAPPEKDYFTEDEVNAMTSEEKYQNAEKIMASLPKWKK